MSFVQFAYNFNGWFRTGDLGIIDKENNMFLVRRCKSMLLSSNGQNVYPEEIEVKTERTSVCFRVNYSTARRKIRSTRCPQRRPAGKRRYFGRDTTRNNGKEHRNIEFANSVILPNLRL